MMNIKFKYILIPLLTILIISSLGISTFADSDEIPNEPQYPTELIATDEVTVGGKVVFECLDKIEENIVIPFYYTEDSITVEKYLEYDLNGNIKYIYVAENEEQPTYSVILSNFIMTQEYVSGISGTEVTIPHCDLPTMSTLDMRDNPDNYEFKCWRFEASNEIRFYYPGDTIVIPNRDITLYAIFVEKGTETVIPDTHNIIFKSNDESNSVIESIDIYAGNPVEMPDSLFIQEDYTFSHWTDGTANYNPGDTYIMPDHDVTMTAVWVKDSFDFTVTLDSQHARQGDTVTLTVSIQDNPGMISGGLTMNYDSDKFTFQSVNGGEILKNADIHTETVSTGNISVEWNSSGQICEGDGDILTLTFKVNEDVPDGAYKFTVCSPVLYTSENKKLHADNASGNLIVHDGIIGDVNKDKKTDDTDLTLLKQYFAGWVNTAESIIDKFAADINMDGQLTRSDLMILARCLALWEGYHFGIPIIIQ